jgi:2-octaprenyl-6-methoxyphenol hydroxylase
MSRAEQPGPAVAQTAAHDAADAAVDVDIAIVGGGMVGASLALALAPSSLRIALVEGVDPAAAAPQPSFDDRTTALGNGTRRILEALGVWEQVRPEAAPIRSIHVSDAGRYGFARLEAAQQGVDAFGYVVVNRVLGRALWSRLGAQPALLRCMPARATGGGLAGDARVLALDSPGADVPKALRARLLVAADGAQSLLRSVAGIEAEVADYGQVAVIANLAPDRPHQDVAYERFTPSGPIALLPLASGDWGVVWTLTPERAAEALAWDDARFLDELQRCFGWRAGRFTRVGRRASYPLKLTRATAATAERLVLIGNAAQSLHPVAGQGFNLGLRDAATLAELLVDRAAQCAAGGASFDAGAAEVLSEFAQRRAEDRGGVTRFTDGLVRLFGDGRPGVGFARDLGLLLFDLSPTAKAALSRVSWGFAGRTPRLARGLPLAP